MSRCHKQIVCNDNLLNVSSNEKDFQQQTKSVTVDEIGKNIESDVTELKAKKYFSKNPYDWLSKYKSF